ncbi:Gcp-like domain-containing protein [Fomitopsis serialis]|uniref:Gcp-like domain-containing protein n=1 Tax=Fomitopsis serialis TaxID=139415 RepID=UPI0020075886|nr:Gcp-like domain-containing protein [Neoantrodia serialis]KAH9924445.1 Gcp-like domain-containing protein [Neoantrodia serialis]
MSLQDVDGIAYTRGPGIGGCLSVGSNAMRTLAAAMKKPLVAVHHMQAHALTPFLTEPIDSLPTYPFLSLLISGGHTLLLLANSPRDFKILATATDEAIGRTIDKVARALQIPWASGPEEGYELPLYVTPMPGRLQFAFAAFTPYAVASAFQRAVLRHLEDKLDLALRHCSRERIPIRHLVVSGGVASNIYLGKGGSIIRIPMSPIADAPPRLFEYLEEQTHFGHPIDLVFPPVSLCTDNAAMIAWASMDRFLSGNTDPYTIDLKAKWSIEDLDAPPFNTMFPPGTRLHDVYYIGSNVGV